MNFHHFATHTIDTLPITAKTRQNYAGAYRRHLEPSLSRFDIADVTKQHIEQALAGLPPQSAYQALMVCKTIYREAVNSGLLEHAPTDKVRTPRVTASPPKFLTWEQVKSLDFGRHREHVKFLALHGLRWGEAVALTPDDIRDGRVHITKSIHGAPKSAAGVRTVPYLGHFQPFSPDRRSLAAALRFHDVTIHSLRHTFAYLLKSSGVHVTTAQKLMGHASPTLTLAIYTAVFDSEVDVAGQLLRMAVGPDA